MAERLEHSEAGEVLSLGVAWREYDVSAAGRLMLAGLLLAIEQWRFSIVYPVLKLAFRYPERWDNSLTIVLSYPAYGLIGLTVWHWLRGGVRRALVFHRGGAVSTPYRLWDFSGDWPGRWYRIHGAHGQIVSVRARPAMTLTWGGAQSDVYDVVAVMKDGYVTTIAVYLDKDEAHRLAEMATQCLADIRALDARPLDLRSKDRLPAAWAAARLARILLGPNCREYIDKDRGGAVTEQGMIWWEGGLSKGLLGLTAMLGLAVLPLPFCIAIAESYANGAWWVPAGIHAIALLVIYLAVGRKIPECRFRGIQRQLGFTRDGGMPTLYGLGMYGAVEAVNGKHDDVLRIAAIPTAKRWGVAFYGEVNTIIVANDLSQEAAIDLAHGLRVALAGMREEIRPSTASIPKRAYPKSLKYRRHLAQQRVHQVSSQKTTTGASDARALRVTR